MKNRLFIFLLFVAVVGVPTDNLLKSFDNYGFIKPL